MRHLALTPDRDTPGDNDYTGAFDPEANRYVRYYEGVGDEVIRSKVDVSKKNGARRAQTLRWIAAAAPFDRLAIFCHGWGDGIQLGFSRGAELESLAAAVAAASTDRLKVALYACSTARSDGPPGDGGEGGFADSLRDLLASAGRPEVTVFGHTSAGHTTRNPQCRMFVPGCAVGGVRIAETGSAQYGRLLRRLRDGGDPLRWTMPYMTLEEIRDAIG